MAIKGKYTSIYDVIERVRRSGISDFTEEEAKEWTWEVMSLMGVPSFYVNKVAILPVENARATFPYDIADFSEGGVREYYTKTVLTKEGDIYYSPDSVGASSSNTNFNFEAPSIVYVDGVQVDEGDQYLTTVSENIYEQQDFTYRINNNFIETGFKTGVIELAYKAFPSDNEFNPMIEDDAKTIRAVVSYISRSVINRMWLRDEVSDKKKRFFDQDYAFAVAAARSNSNIGSIDDWEAIRARTQRMYKDPNLHKLGFRGYGNGEHLDIK